MAGIVVAGSTTSEDLVTVVPAGGSAPDGDELRRFARRSLRGRRLQLIVDGGEPVDVPPVVGEALAEVVSILGRGRPVRVMAENVELSTGEAAAILGVTRPTVVKLMNDGVLPYTRPNSSRRVALHDVLTYKERRSRARREALDELTADAIDMGVYDEAIRRGRQPSDDHPDE
ncbi:helix-turn-helix domain-containing protein [Micromonospora sp. WMMD998]|uniref:helix-turn-helix domain-containing protein n=1 Tax=Micromonospora sp. WMMD998 TaxID=3016092 RepID=UPI00249BD9CD|nr:helix-turn-helix domain-containing protein [Micromonospora sp. WMMD998]WFE41498.1 helix-turn-helix domain-containing protein [Micromonospora sp. WMMD998]